MSISGLLYPRTAALNEDDENNDKQHACNDPDDCGTFHSDILPPLNSEFNSQYWERSRAYLAPRGNKLPGLDHCRTGQRQSQAFCGPVNPKAQLLLLYLRAAALDKNSQHNDKKHAGYNPDNYRAFHLHSSLNHLPKNVLNDSIIKITAGPKVTRKSAGKIKIRAGKPV